MTKQQALTEAQQASRKSQGNVHYVNEYRCEVSETAPEGLTYTVSLSPGRTLCHRGVTVETYLNGEKLIQEGE